MERSKTGRKMTDRKRRRWFSMAHKDKRISPLADRLNVEETHSFYGRVIKSAMPNSFQDSVVALEEALRFVDEVIEKSKSIQYDGNIYYSSDKNTFYGTYANPQTKQMELHKLNGGGEKLELNFAKWADFKRVAPIDLLKVSHSVLSRFNAQHYKV